jgi:hypothetical protein
MSLLVLWADVAPPARRTWRSGPNACLAATPSGWNDGTYAPCYGYVKPGRQFCHQHDPEIQTPEHKAAVAAKIALGRSRRKLTKPVLADLIQVAAWVGEAELIG